MTQPDLFTSPTPAAVADAPFFNTVELAGAPLAQAKRKANDQELRVLKIFSNLPGEKLGPSEVWICGSEEDKAWLLTSVRRAMTSLTDAGKLIKLDEMRDGPYGKPEHLWMTPPPPTTGDL